ncbi:something about silencing protein 10 [Venturia canescens]|uniref:something about silencing protein 10 n=1 Tax=Venturia canescens TaxID=32260 RepID=UPI001C9CBC02|nr:something about silencing protein 10 [Venturia canescens]
MSSKKRFKNDPEDEDIKYDSENVTDSEDEYSDNERRLLEKVRKKRTLENFDSEDEVYGLEDEDEMDNEDGDEKDSMASDIEGLPKDDDLPDERAWGKKKRAFYSTDYVDPDYATANRKDMAIAEMEEKEARNIQKRLAEQLDDADFGLDLLQPAGEGRESEADDEHIVKTDLSKLGKREKLALMQKESPEFGALVTDFKERMEEAKNILSPFLMLVERGKCPDTLAVSFVRMKYQLILNYCVNISFYLILKAKRLSINSHPVIKRLAQYRQLLGQLESGQGKLLVEVKEIVEAERAGKALYNVTDNNLINEKLPTKSKEKSSKINDKGDQSMTELVEGDVNKEESIEDEDSIFSHDEHEEPNDEEKTLQEDEKRGITYQIAKNKGLTPHRKKEQRNPRVKHRNKYRKAKIRRKGAVREVRKEVNRYAGEISGIKASVKKGIKIK